MNLLLRYLAIGTGGFIGTVARYGVSQLFSRSSAVFPFNTMIINVTGSFILGWSATYFLAKNITGPLPLAITVGFVGGYTTFSTYMYESDKLVLNGAGILAILNLAGSIILGLVAVRLGIMLAQRA